MGSRREGSRCSVTLLESIIRAIPEIPEIPEKKVIRALHVDPEHGPAGPAGPAAGLQLTESYVRLSQISYVRFCQLNSGRIESGPLGPPSLQPNYSEIEVHRQASRDRHGPSPQTSSSSFFLHFAAISQGRHEIRSSCQ